MAGQLCTGKKVGESAKNSQNINHPMKCIRGIHDYFAVE
jgi:hypothetical protein